MIVSIWRYGIELFRFENIRQKLNNPIVQDYNIIILG